jgi:hypothetical protein
LLRNPGLPKNHGGFDPRYSITFPNFLVLGGFGRGVLPN